VNELASIVKEGRLALSRGLATVLATVVAARGSAYRRPGARMLVTSEGWRAGSISGGCLEADVTRQAAFLVANGRALVRSYDTSEDAGARLGCGGEIDVLLEPLDAPFLEVLARVEELVVERGRLVAALREQGWRPPETQANFVWLATGARTEEIAAELSAQGLSVRPFAGEGIRCSVDVPDANAALVAALRAFAPGR